MGGTFDHKIRVWILVGILRLNRFENIEIDKAFWQVFLVPKAHKEADSSPSKLVEAHNFPMSPRECPSSNLSLEGFKSPKAANYAQKQQ